MREEFLKEIENEDKNINEQIFGEYFNYQSTSSLVKELSEDNENKNDMIVKYLNESLIDLRNFNNSKEIPKDENPKKIVNIVEKMINFNKLQKIKGHNSDIAKRIKILTSKQMLQRLSIALVQVKTGNTSENLLNEIRQIVYSLYRNY